MRAPVTWRAGFGLVLFGAALLVYSLPRLAPHPVVALDMPVSLSPGHIKTGTFAVNPDTLFYIDIETDRQFRIPPDCDPRNALRTQFILSSEDGQLIEQGSSPWEDTGLTIADFMGPTRYTFDAEILPGASCLNAGNPRLKVQTHPSPSGLYVSLSWFSVLFVGIGIALLISPLLSGRLSKKPIGMSILGRGEIDLRPIKRGALSRMSLPAAPFVGLLYAQFSLIIVTIGFLVFGLGWGYYRHSVGLFIVSDDLSPIMKSRSCGDAWIVHVDKKEKWYLNSTKTTPQELAGLLRQQLGDQTNCAVYLDVAPSLTYQVAIHAIDEIQTTQAKVVVLLMPKTKGVSTRQSINPCEAMNHCQSSTPKSR